MDCTLKHIDVSGFKGIELANGLLSLKIVPEIGGKIVSIYDLSSQWEWLSSNPYLPLRLPRYDGPFITDYDSGGLDECFPSISPVGYPAEPWQQAAIPDHGELWCQPWDVEVVTATAEQIDLSMICHGVRLPYRFERRLTLTAESHVVTLDYRVTNLTPFAMPFVWSIHPILRIEAGMRLSLPAHVEKVRIEGATNDFLGESGTHCDWPLAKIEDGQVIDLSRVPAAVFGQAAKIYTLPLPGDEFAEAALVDESNQRSLRFRFRPSEITHVGLWMNYGGWSGCGSSPYFNLGLEPCIGGADSLTAAQGLKEYATLSAKQSAKWSLSMIIGQTGIEAGI